MDSTRVISALSPLVTERRLARMREVLSYRTRHIAVVLEDVYQSHNASAVLRSCDSFGVQDIYPLEVRNSFRVNPEISLGSGRWLTVHRAPGASVQSRLQEIRTAGYRIAATSPHGQALTPSELPLEHPIALVFGTELDGITEDVTQVADYHLRIPMYGFAESFNISVAVAIVLHVLCERLRSGTVAWRLDREAREALLASWLQADVKGAEEVLRRMQEANA